mmetsp:Transcript_55756/g.130094  ORF Transcript_55756/g.130094 Transcript_55756/m.130094 type:complete len:234 (+) Transcript_55756:848-1549(+)
MVHIRCEEAGQVVLFRPVPGNVRRMVFGSDLAQHVLEDHSRGPKEDDAGIDASGLQPGARLPSSFAEEGAAIHHLPVFNVTITPYKGCRRLKLEQIAQRFERNGVNVQEHDFVVFNKIPCTQLCKHSIKASPLRSVQCRDAIYVVNLVEFPDLAQLLQIVCWQIVRVHQYQICVLASFNLKLLKSFAQHSCAKGIASAGTPNGTGISMTRPAFVSNFLLKLLIRMRCLRFTAD